MQTYDMKSTKPTRLTTPQRTPFNTIIPYKLVNKVNTVALVPLCTHGSWVFSQTDHSIIKFTDDARGWLNRMLARGGPSHQVVQQYLVLTLMTGLLTSYLIKSKVDGHWLKEKKSTFLPHTWRGSGICRKPHVSWSHNVWESTWTTNTSVLVKKAQQMLFFLRKLKQAKLCLVSF